MRISNKILKCNKLKIQNRIHFSFFLRVIDDVDKLFLNAVWPIHLTLFPNSAGVYFGQLFDINFTCHKISQNTKITAVGVSRATQLQFSSFYLIFNSPNNSNV